MPRTSSLPALTSWNRLNDALMATCDERQLHRLLTAERDGLARPTFLRRIHSRLNRVRAQRERQELAP